MNNSINELLLSSVNHIAKEKNIPHELIKDFLVESIKKAYIKQNYEDNLDVYFDLKTGELITKKYYLVVKDNENFDEYIHILDTDPRVKENNLKVDEYYYESFDISKEFKQQQVQQILQSFKQKIIEVSNQRVYKSWTPMIGEIILAEIEKEDKKGNFFTINLENQFDKNNNPLESSLGFLSKKELNPLEELDVSKKYHFVVISIKEQSKFCPVILSRASEKLVEYYMSIEIPEIDDGSIRIVKSARIAGVKTKVLVESKVLLPIEPASICVGPKGSRVKTISNLIGGEKIEIINYSDDPIVLITNLFDRSKLVGIQLNKTENSKSATLIVKNNAILQTIGKKGCNVKLASYLSGWNINIISEEEAVLNNIDFLSTSSNEFNEHFKKNNKFKDNYDLDILSLDDSDINEIINNSLINDDQYEYENEDQEKNLNDEKLEEDTNNIFVNFDENDEINELNQAFKHELEKAFKK